LAPLALCEPLSIADVALIQRPAPAAWLHARAVRGGQRGRDAPDEGARSVRQQLRDMAPGLDLWEPRGPRLWGETTVSGQEEADLAVG
jgi:hypothetical protein